MNNIVSCHEDCRYDRGAETVDGNIALLATLSLVVTTADSKRCCVDKIHHGKLPSEVCGAYMYSQSATILENACGDLTCIVILVGSLESRICCD